MIFSLEKSFEILERTPRVLQTLLHDISDEWTLNNEGPDTFSAYDVTGHLLHGERTDWMARTMIIINEGTTRTFDTYDRFAMYEESKGKSLQQLLNEFAEARAENIALLKSLDITEGMLNKKGIHPKFGEVTLRQLLSTYVIHDLTHLAQIARVMAKQYKGEMGPWLEYFRQMQ